MFTGLGDLWSLVLKPYLTFVQLNPHLKIWEFITITQSSAPSSTGNVGVINPGSLSWSICHLFSLLRLFMPVKVIKLVPHWSQACIWNKRKSQPPNCLPVCAHVIGCLDVNDISLTLDKYVYLCPAIYGLTHPVKKHGILWRYFRRATEQARLK